MSMHHDWLSLIEISGPFLAVPVLKEAFPQGLEALDPSKRKRLRQAYDEWQEALETGDPRFDELHAAWIDEVLARGLELDEGGRGDVLKRRDWCAANVVVDLSEHGVSLSPEFAVVPDGGKPLLLIQTHGPEVDLEATQRLDGWASTPAERMVALCRATGCRLGLVTNGERWMLVDAPVGAVTTFASWYARLWGQEPVTLQAFVHLLGIRRFFVDESERLPALLDRSLKYQDEVTDALGEQVRRAVEVLIQALDKADQDRDRTLLRDVKEAELYEAALTVMMRLVFLLCAEERGLLLLGDERYEAHYAVSTLRMQLRAESDEILERRWDAWSRLLAVFRAVYGGIEHENLRLPALGGSLFDPDRFPFLEGRAKGSHWRTDAAKPLPIDNRTVLLLLEAIQQFQGRTLSYRALDVEQIGYVYEGLLERTVKRTTDVTLELDATKSAQSPWVTLAELESARLDGAERLVALLRERSGSSESRIRNDLARSVDDALAERLLTACHGDTVLRDRVRPFAHLLRTDPWGYPLVHPAGAYVVTTGSDRRETGTHYTPKSLTEAIVAETLTPVAYVGPAEGKPRAEWVLKSPAELLDLKICDPAMGSGAFLVQACRWLADRLVEAWARAEAQGHTVGIDGRVAEAGATVEPLPRDVEERTIVARRLVAERCLYGVDLNPLAVELAKLSLWLTTLAKGRPFGFLDHNLRQGDSLLGIHRLDQLTQLTMNPSGQGQMRLFGQTIERAVREAIELRQRLRETPIRDIRDVEVMAHLDADARQRLEVPELIADAFIGEMFAAGGTGAALESALASLAVQAGRAIDGDQETQAAMRRRAAAALATDLPAGKPSRRPFHWPLEFPEVFTQQRCGFDALIGNPPFITGKRISTVLGGAYQTYLKATVQDSKGAADLAVFFFRRTFSVSRDRGLIGLIGTKSISEGDSRVVGLAWLLENGACIVSAKHEIEWPGSASVIVSLVVLHRGRWAGKVSLNGGNVPGIGSNLMVESNIGITGWRSEPHALKSNESRRSDGIKIQGDGFILTEEERRILLMQDEKSEAVISRYLTGKDIAQNPLSEPSNWIVNFSQMSRNEAERYRAAFNHVEIHVKPYREKLRGQIHEADFWKFWDKRESFFEAMKGRRRILACPSTAKYLLMVFIDENLVPSHSVKLFAFSDDSSFATMQSIVHEVWARQHSGKLGQTLAYNLSRAFATFPWPQEKPSAEGGSSLLRLRHSLCAERHIGLTDLYNLMHSPTEVSAEFERLRSAHVRIDRETVTAYGWGDLDLEHGFHEVPYLPENDRVRFTISERSRLEVLRRLTELNHQRYEEEVAQGLHGGTAARMPRRVRRTETVQPSLDLDARPARAQHGMSPAAAILDFLRAHPGWHAKSDILAATGITDGHWNAAIAELLAGGRIERQGERRGARYRATNDAEGSA